VRGRWALRAVANRHCWVFDRHPGPWARETALDLRDARPRRAHRSAGCPARALPGGSAGVVLAYTVNDVVNGARGRLLNRHLDAARGLQVLVVEPIAGRVIPWWLEWRGDLSGPGAAPTNGDSRGFSLMWSPGSTALRVWVTRAG
jgi:hypothetical protein